MSDTDTIQLTADDLDNNGGIFCPNPKAGMHLWNAHPKVFIHIAAKGQGQCPYCGTKYGLISGKSRSSH